MNKCTFGWLLLIGFLWCAAPPSPQVVAGLRGFLPEGGDPKQIGEHRLALKAPGDSTTGIVEEEAPPKPPVQDQTGGRAVTPEKTAPPALQPYRPSERIPADQAVDFPADI